MKDYHFPDLDVIEQDIKNIVGLFGDTLGYKIFPKYNIHKKIKTHWKKKEIIDLLKKKGQALDKAVKNNKHDGLVVIISCHGIQDHIVTSDYKRINKDTVHRIFSVDYPSLREIPGIFIYDCCDGDNDLERNESRAESDAPKLQDGKKIKSKGNDQKEFEKEGTQETTKIYGQDQQMWFKGEANPDYKLVIVNSSNTGFVSQADSTSGSFMIQKLTEQMVNNIENRNKLFLYQIFHGIQKELHDGGKQLIEAKYNNQLEYVKFRRKRDNQNNKVIELQHVQIASDSIYHQENEDSVRL